MKARRGVGTVVTIAALVVVFLLGIGVAYVATAGSSSTFTTTVNNGTTSTSTSTITVNSGGLSTVTSTSTLTSTATSTLTSTLTSVSTSISTLNGSAQPLTTDKFSLGLTNYVISAYDWWTLAANQGLFKEYLPNVQIVDLSTGSSTAVASELSGSLDVVMTTLTAVPPAVQQGGDVGIFAEYDFSGPAPSSALVVSANSSITSIQQLKGTTIALDAPGGISATLVISELAQAGLVENVDYKVVYAGTATASLALVLSGKASAKGEPITSPDIQNGQTRVIGTYNENFGSTGLVTTQSFATAHPQDLQAVVKFFNLVFQYYYANPQLVYQLLESSTYGLNNATALQAYSESNWSTNGAIYLSSIASMQQFLITGGTINATMPVTSYIIQGYVPLECYWPGYKLPVTTGTSTSTSSSTSTTATAAIPGMPASCSSAI